MAEEAPTAGNGEITPVIPPGLAAGWEKLHYTVHRCSPSLAPDSDDGSCLPLSARCTELAIISSSSALDSVTEAPDGPGRADGPLGSRELFVSDIVEQKNKITQKNKIAPQSKVARSVQLPDS